MLAGFLMGVVGLPIAWALGFIDPVEWNQAFWATFRLNLMVLAVALSSAGIVTAATFLGYVGIRGFRTPRGFLSYHHADQSTIDEVRSEFAAADLQVEYIPFEPAGHDRVIEETQRKIRQNTFLLVIPGPGGTFSDSEVYAASALAKPIIILSMGEQTRLPNTAYQGYPVFSLTRLRQEKMLPLKIFVDFASGHWRQAFISLARGAKRSFSPFEHAVGCSFILLKCIDTFGMLFPILLKAQPFLLGLTLGVWNTAFAGRSSRSKIG
jgi:hypothetical protein